MAGSGDSRAPATTRTPGRIARALDSDLFYSFRRSPLVIAAALVTVTYFLAAGLAHCIAPHYPFDP